MSPVYHNGGRLETIPCAKQHVSWFGRLASYTDIVNQLTD